MKPRKRRRRLTPDEVERVRNGERFGVGKSTVSRILKGKYYHSTDDKDESDDGGQQQRVDSEEEKIR